jgi:hypothetical protein
MRLVPALATRYGGQEMAWGAVTHRQHFGIVGSTGGRGDRDPLLRHHYLVDTLSECLDRGANKFALRAEHAARRQQQGRPEGAANRHEGRTNRRERSWRGMPSAHLLMCLQDTRLVLTPAATALGRSRQPRGPSQQCVRHRGHQPLVAVGAPRLLRAQRREPLLEPLDGERADPGVLLRRTSERITGTDTRKIDAGAVPYLPLPRRTQVLELGARILPARSNGRGIAEG